MAYILGEREFWGLPFKVSPAVLVPRPDSETLIEAALALMPDRQRPWRILDLGVGLGLPAADLLREFPDASGVGLEASAAALAVAAGQRGRLGRGGARAARRRRLAAAGWAERLGGPFDLLVSNPPYIEAAAIDGLMPEVARFEPQTGARWRDRTGLSAYRAIADSGARLVVPGGRLLVEAGEGQAAEISRIFRVRGACVEAPWKDLGGIDRVVVGDAQH